MKLHKKIIFRGRLELLSGLHIGDSKETTEIGGVDSPVVRRKDNNEPYIPGSSIKGKMRSLLDLADGKADTTRLSDHPNADLFGTLGPDNKSGHPSRLLVRDAYLVRSSAAKLRESEFTDMPYTEVKFENTIDRVQGKAQHPRQFERVPAGAEFELEFVINVIAPTDQDAQIAEHKLLKTFHAGIALLQDDYLGGCGSRGYGQVRIHLPEPTHKLVKDYFHGAGASAV